MVQLKEPEEDDTSLADDSFNSKMVQLKENFRLQYKIAKYVSIPKWFN